MMDHFRVVVNLRECIRIFQDMSEVMYSVWFEKKTIPGGSHMFIELEVSPHLLIFLNQG